MDEGNSQNNVKYSVSTAESKQVFFIALLLLLDEVKHIQFEPRFHAV